MSPISDPNPYADVAADLRFAVDPKSIAVVGASDNVDKLGGRCLQYLKNFGFKGAIYPINPARGETQGVKTYPNFDALPAVAELAVIALPGGQAVEAVEQCARHGTRVAVILTAGFGEADDAGRAQERRMVDAARATGMRLIGPNTQGISNFSNGAIANFSTMFVETTPEDGPVAIVSQSGGGSSVPFGLLRERGIGVRYCHAVGNQCDVTVSELALAIARDPALKLLLLYLEGIPDANHIAELGAVARERNLPVLVLKSGRTAAGQKASLSHTGSLATEDRVVDAFLAHHGLHRVDDVGDMVKAAELYLKDWKPGGRRLV
ncbi:MAG: CoA-binding protein, partial [Rhodanobacter sp.]